MINEKALLEKVGFRKTLPHWGATTPTLHQANFMEPESNYKNG